MSVFFSTETKCPVCTKPVVPYVESEIVPDHAKELLPDMMVKTPDQIRCPHCGELFSANVRGFTQLTNGTPNREYITANLGLILKAKPSHS